MSDIPHIWISAMVVMLSALTGAARVQAQPAADNPGGERESERVAILPFVNLSAHSEDDWIGSGIAQTLLIEFENRSPLDVITSAGVPEVTGGAGAGSLDSDSRDAQVGSLAELGSRLRVRWVLSGGYQRIGNRLRITGQLVDVTTRSVVRATKVDGDVSELFALQDQLAEDLIAGRPPDSAPVPLTPNQPGTSSGTVASAGERSAPDARSDAPSSVGVAGYTAPGLIDGPPAPVPPEVIRRDERGRATIRATRLTESIQLDGQLDEQIYHTVPAITGFIQQAPDEGAPATEKTEAWVAFDEDNLYVAGRIWDSAPPSEWVANEMRRDTRQLRQNDTFAVSLDTFYDRRNGVAFYTNPLGALADFAITNEGNPNSDWNPVWDVRTGRFEGGWTVEMEIPFQSLRYRQGPTQVWGIQLRRNVRRKNEWAYVTPLPISAGAGSGGIFRISESATLVGVDVPSGSRNLEIKPYGIGGVSTDLNASPPEQNAGDGDVGFDVKYGITQNLTADFTVNTDFAQVEVDEQQVNLTRFSLFFPEKREFFLEGRGIFDFARGGSTGFGGALRRGGQGGGFFGGGDAPTMFYSRRIGLEDGVVVPIIAGGRATGKVGPFDVGALNIQTDDEEISGAETTNFTVVRLKRDVFRRSSIGAIFTNRSVSLAGDGANQAYGVDATFSFYENVNLLGYIAKTQTPGIHSEDTSYQGRFNYTGDRYGFLGEHLLVENSFIPEVGFLRRNNFRRTYTTGRFSPRPRSIQAIRQFRLEGSFGYFEQADTGLLETRQSQLGFSTEFENSDRVGINVADNYERLDSAFSPGPGVTFPPGIYTFQDLEATYSLGAQHRLVGTFTVRAGEYFDGNLRSVGFSQGRLEITQRFSLEPTVSVNWVDTPRGSFRTDLAVARVNYTFTPRMFFSGLVQYNSASNTVSNNLRLRWEYSPGSELFVVYTEDRDTDPLFPDRYTQLRNRGLVIKINRLFRF